jgi:hypothetical protein
MKYQCRDCPTVGEENFYPNARYYCKICWNKRTAKKQKDKVTLLKEEFGGKCSRCGYDKCQDALEFHHVDPKEKEFHLGARRGLNINLLREELNKCIIVCRNCHAELHAEIKCTPKMTPLID